MWVFKELIRKSADVNQAVAFWAEFDEHTKVRYAQDQSLQHVAWLERIQPRHLANQGNGIAEIAIVCKRKLECVSDAAKLFSTNLPASS